MDTNCDKQQQQPIHITIKFTYRQRVVHWFKRTFSKVFKLKSCYRCCRLTNGDYECTYCDGHNKFKPYK